MMAPLPGAGEFAFTFGKGGLTIELSGTADTDGLHDVKATVSPALKWALRHLGDDDGLSAADWLKEAIIAEARTLPPSWVEPITAAIAVAIGPPPAARPAV
jgi:hypothetical protein